MCGQEATDTASRLHGELQGARQQVQKLQTASEASKVVTTQQAADIQVRHSVLCILICMPTSIMLK